MRTKLLARAMRHADKPGAGAAQRRKLGLTGREKAAVVMREFHRGKLRSRSGAVVTDEQQAKAIAMSEGRRAENDPPGPRTKRRPTMRRQQPIDETAVRELRLFAENEGKLYPMRQAIQRSLMKKMAAGKYKPEGGAKAWTYWFTAAAKMYQKEIGAGDLNLSFPPAVRRAAAAEFEVDERARMRAGEYGPTGGPKGTAMHKGTHAGHSKHKSAVGHHSKAVHHKSKAHHSPKHHPARPAAFGPHHASGAHHPGHHGTAVPSPSAHTSHAVHHPKRSYASGAPASEWDRLWHAYVEANEKGSLSEQIRAGKRLLRFDRIHGTPPMQHVVHMLREAKELLAKHQEAFKEAKKLETELERADGHVKRHRARHAHAAPHHHGLGLGLHKAHKGHKSHAGPKTAKARNSLF